MSTAPLTAPKLAVYLGVSDETVRRWCKQRVFPSHRIAGRRRYFLNEVLEHMKARKA